MHPLIFIGIQIIVIKIKKLNEDGVSFALFESYQALFVLFLHVRLPELDARNDEPVIDRKADYLQDANG